MKTKNTISVLLIAFLCAFSIPIMGGTPSAIHNNTDYMDTAVILSGDSSDYGISFATYFGGSEDEQFKGIVTDSQDNIYFVGDTWSVDLPMVNSFDPTYNPGGWDGFLAKFSPDGSELLFSTYFGSPDTTQPQAITIDEQDNIWICGTSWSSGLPLVNPIDDTYGGGSDAFVAQFSPDGELMFSSYLGGSSDERPRGIAAEAGIVYVTGSTFSQDFPKVNPLFPDSLGDGFWTKIDTVQNEISWSTRFDGLGDDVAIDSNGDVYLTGRTRGPSFPATTSFAPLFDDRWHEDSFVLKTNANGNSIGYATRVGGNQPDLSNCISLLADGSVVVAGYTYSDDMPVVNPFKGTFGGERDGFLYILDSTGSSLEYLTYFGGSSLDIIANLEIDSTGNFVISGTTFSQDFPLVQPLFDTLEVGTSDAFVSILNPLTNELTFSSLFSGTTYGTGMTVDTDDSIIFGGNTEYSASSLPVKNALYPYNSGKQDSFVCKLSSIPPDNTPPVTTIELSGTLGLNDWFISDVLVTLNAADDFSGVDYTEYSYDGINWHLYSGEFLVPIDGENIIYYRSIDNAGNEEAINPCSVKIDKSVPLEWNRTWDGGDYDQGNNIAIDSSGNIYVVGSTWSSGVYDICLIKYDSSGVQQWSRTWGYGSHDYAMGIALDSSDNIYIVGAVAGAFLDVYLVKLDSSGVIQWYRTWGGSESERGTAIVIDSSDNIYITGSGSSFGNGRTDMYLVKFNSLGVIQWYRTYGGSGDDRGKAIALDSSGYIYVAGYRDRGHLDIFLVKYDDTGNMQWERSWGTLNDEYGYEVAIDSRGYIYVLGSTWTDGSYSVVLLKYTSEGDLLGNQFPSGLPMDAPHGYYGIYFLGSPCAITLDSSDNIYIAGFTTNFGTKLPDMYLVIISDTGVPLLSRTWGGSGDDRCMGIALDSSNNIYLAGLANNDICLVKYNSEFPKTTIELSGTTDLNGWFISDVLVTLNAADDFSGVDYTEFSYDGINWHLYSGSFVISIDGDYTIYYRSTDIAGNTEIAQSVTFKIRKIPSKIVEEVITILLNLEVPSEAQFRINWAIYKLSRSVTKFESGHFYAAFYYIQYALGHLMCAEIYGAEVQEVIDILVTLVRGLTDDAIEDVIEMVGEDNYFVVIAIEKYNIALQKLSNNEFDKAVKYFKIAYKNAMKARVKWIPEFFIVDLQDRIADIQELKEEEEIPFIARIYLKYAEYKIQGAIYMANEGFLDISLYKLSDAIYFLMRADSYGVNTIFVINEIMSNINDMVYLKISDAESVLIGAESALIETAWTKYYNAQDAWENGNYYTAIEQYIIALEKAEDALLPIF